MDKRKFLGWNIACRFKLEDLWVGAFWKQTGHCIDLYICLIPCFPIHISWWWTYTRAWWWSNE